jgi:hypothetical protein
VSRDIKKKKKCKSLYSATEKPMIQSKITSHENNKKEE